MSVLPLVIGWLLLSLYWLWICVPQSARRTLREEQSERTTGGHIDD